MLLKIKKPIENPKTKRRFLSTAIREDQYRQFTKQMKSKGFVPAQGKKGRSSLGESVFLREVLIAAKIISR